MGTAAAAAVAELEGGHSALSIFLSLFLLHFTSSFFPSFYLDYLLAQG